MSSKGKTLSAQIPEGKKQGFDGAAHEPESRAAYHRLSDVEREAIQQGVMQPNSAALRRKRRWTKFTACTVALSGGEVRSSQNLTDMVYLSHDKAA
jgi:hypothetical protein